MSSSGGGALWDETELGHGGPLVIDGLGADYAAAVDVLLGLSAAVPGEPLMLAHRLAAWDWY